MANTGIFYGSSTGTTADVARRIASALGVAETDIHDVAESSPSDVAPYSTLLLGTSTWGAGELQDDWQDFIAGLSALDLKGKKVALFGVGDESMADTFCNGVGIIADRLKDTGAELVGAFPTAPYSYDHSDADRAGGVAVGLLLDETNHPDVTDSRIKEWTSML